MEQLVELLGETLLAQYVEDAHRLQNLAFCDLVIGVIRLLLKLVVAAVLLLDLLIELSYENYLIQLLNLLIQALFDDLDVLGGGLERLAQTLDLALDLRGRFFIINGIPLYVYDMDISIK